MPFTKNDKEDEIDEVMKEDVPRRALIEAHALVSKPVTDLFQRTLRANKQAFTFDGVAKQSGYMQIQIPGDKRFIYKIGMELVPKDHNLDLSQFKNAKNFESITVSMSKFFKYAESIFEMLQGNVKKDCPMVMDWKLQIDNSNSTMYIDPSHSKRIGFTVQPIAVKQQQKKSQSSSSSSSSSAGKRSK